MRAPWAALLLCLVRGATPRPGDEVGPALGDLVAAVDDEAGFDDATCFDAGAGLLERDAVPFVDERGAQREARTLNEAVAAGASYVGHGIVSIKDDPRRAGWSVSVLRVESRSHERALRRLLSMAHFAAHNWRNVQRVAAALHWRKKGLVALLVDPAPGRDLHAQLLSHALFDLSPHRMDPFDDRTVFRGATAAPQPVSETDIIAPRPTRGTAIDVTKGAPEGKHKPGLEITSGGSAFGAFGPKRSPKVGRITDQRLPLLDAEFRMAVVLRDVLVLLADAHASRTVVRMVHPAYLAAVSAVAPRTPENLPVEDAADVPAHVRLDVAALLAAKSLPVGAEAVAPPAGGCVSLGRASVAAPEGALGLPVGPPWDVWLFGVLAQQLACRYARTDCDSPGGPQPRPEPAGPVPLARSLSEEGIASPHDSAPPNRSAGKADSTPSTSPSTVADPSLSIDLSMDSAGRDSSKSGSPSQIGASPPANGSAPPSGLVPLGDAPERPGASPSPGAGDQSRAARERLRRETYGLHVLRDADLDALRSDAELGIDAASAELRALVHDALVVEPGKRPAAADLLGHPFFARYFDSPETLADPFEYSPDARRPPVPAATHCAPSAPPAGSNIAASSPAPQPDDPHPPDDDLPSGHRAAAGWAAGAAGLYTAFSALLVCVLRRRRTRLDREALSRAPLYAFVSQAEAP